KRDPGDFEPPRAALVSLKTTTSGFACTFRGPPIPRCGCTQAVSASSRAASWKACRQMSASFSVVGIARGRKDQKRNEAMAVIVTQRRSLWEVARQVKCHIDAGEDADALAKELLAWVLEVADQPMPNPNRCLVEIPDTFAVARWPRDAEVAEIARCILGTLKYEPHTADTAMLRRALDIIAEVAGR